MTPIGSKRLWFCGITLVLLLFVFGPFTAVDAVQPRTVPETPNILFVSLDDLNDWVRVLGGHTGGMDIHTPNLDRLAASSVLFTNAHTPAPLCAPARTAIMTGVHAARTGAAFERGDGPVWRKVPALRTVETLEQFFRNRGYKTLGAGKVYHAQAPPWTTVTQIEPANWDFYFPSPYLSHPHQIRPPHDVIFPEHVDNATRRAFGGEWWTWGPLQADDTKMADYHVVEWASYELKRSHEKPFFMAIGTWKPHDPWEVPQKYFDMYPLEKVVLPSFKEDDLKDAFDHGRRGIHKWVLENDQWARVIQSYAASITFADAMLGRLLDALDQSPHADNTVLVVWSDHGMHMGEKENFEKFTLWERSTRVPLLMRVPGLTQAGSRVDQPVSLMDLYPTLAEIAGFEPPSHADGTSLVPQFTDPGMNRPPAVTSLIFDDHKARHLGPLRTPETGHAVRSRHHRYIYYTSSGFEELYDHRSDPGEWTNIAYKQENRATIEQHRAFLRNLLPDLVWKQGTPAGYRVGGDGSVERTDFVPMSRHVRGEEN